MKVILANPRGFCAGVERAVRIVEVALEQYGSPIYVRHEIVHNRHVIDALTERGAIFVEDLSDVPRGARVIFSAHGVSPAVWSEARARALNIVDATCPLVTKVHLEALTQARNHRTLIVIGHRDHPEVIGTVGHYLASGGDRVLVVEDEAAAEKVAIDVAKDIAYVTQTTLATDQTARIIAVLQRRIPSLVGPPREDICYATTNRQRAVQALAERCDVIIVLGANHSSNSVRLREVAQAAGADAFLVDDETKIDPRWFEHREIIGVTSGASVPELLVHRLLIKFRIWWPDLIEENLGQPETVQFRLPRELARDPPGRRLEAELPSSVSC
jgi:4-hydroxy-3-methylbut-2-en-1-yl diphosphate reductase